MNQIMESVNEAGKVSIWHCISQAKSCRITKGKIFSEKNMLVNNSGR